MRLTCPNCAARYEVPREAMPAGGRDVQCSNCGHVWFVLAGAEPTAVDVDLTPDQRPTPPADEPEPRPHPQVGDDTDRQPHEDKLRPDPPPDAKAETSSPDKDAHAPATGVPPGRREMQDEDADEIPIVPPSRSLPPDVRRILQEEAALERRRRGLPEPEDDDGAVQSERSGSESDPGRARPPSPPPSRGRRSEGGQDEEPRASQADNAEPADRRDRSATTVPEARRAAAPPPERDRPAVAPRGAISPDQRARDEDLPDIRQITSTLEPDRRRRELRTALVNSAEAERRERTWQHGFRLGFGLMLLVAAILGALYLTAPWLAERLPAAAPLLLGYADAVDAFRVWLQTSLQGLTGPVARM